MEVERNVRKEYLFDALHSNVRLWPHGFSRMVYSTGWFVFSGVVGDVYFRFSKSLADQFD